MKKVILSIAALLSMTVAVAQSETTNPIITAMPSLSIAPDARAAGMGDVGVATDADLNSQHWNPAKYAYMESHGGLTANYTPWLRKLVGDIDLAYLTGYYKWDDLQGVAMSFRYFSMGDVQMTNIDGSFLANARPNEWALDASYYRKLHEYVSMAVALRFMYSDLNNGVNQDSREMKPGWTMAADIALYYKQPIELPMGTSYFNLGFNLQNLGGKIAYTEDIQNFIPATMRLGVGYDLPFDQYNRLTVNIETSKLLVPTRKSKFAASYDPELYKEDPSCAMMTQDEYSKLTSVKGIFQSFADAPGGAAEEFKEVNWGIGLEYTYNHQFFARVGYNHEDYMKGNRRYVTLGAGFHLSIVTFDFAYCIATAASNPLDQTMRFSLGFDLAGIKDLVNNRKR